MIELVWRFLRIRFRLRVFCGNIIDVTLCSSHCILSGGLRFKFRFVPSLVSTRRSCSSLSILGAETWGWYEHLVPYQPFQISLLVCLLIHSLKWCVCWPVSDSPGSPFYWMGCNPWRYSYHSVGTDSPCLFVLGLPLDVKILKFFFSPRLEVWNLTWLFCFMWFLIALHIPYGNWQGADKQTESRPSETET